MKKKVLVALVAAVFLLSFALTGCQGGASQELYDKVLAQFNEAQEKIQEARDNISNMEAERNDLLDELDEAKTKAGELEGMVKSLKEQYELVGATPAETAAKIVKYYHATHEYSVTDLFICSDMAGEVWNMLKTQGIDAIIAIGATGGPVSDILQCNHAWVLAEVAPGEYLALEATGGFAITESENPYYYQGWYFDSPNSLKSHNQLVREYNTRVSIIMDIQNEVIAVAGEHDASTNPVTADKLLAVYEKLVELRDQQDAKLKQVKAELDSLAKKL
jgi:cell division protein FtsB